MNDASPPGYLSRNYALSFAEYGKPLYLPSSKGWLLQRDIPSTSGLQDAMGCYPLFCCQNWNALCADINDLNHELVSLLLVTDPFADIDRAQLQRCFDSVRPYKEHLVVETGNPITAFVSKSHQRHAQKALRDVKVEVCEQPVQYLSEWIRLFGILAERHSISGMRRFSNKAFEMQLAAPGMVMFRASIDGRTIGLDLWYQQGDVAQGHLAAFDELGYQYRASYATKWTLLEYFSKRVQWINLGAGQSMDGSDGLSYFKRGFATGAKRSWLCGRVYRQREYDSLSRLNTARPEAYFPAYRAGELL